MLEIRCPSTELQQVEPRAQPRCNVLYAEECDPSGGELDCERYAVELAANLGHEGGFVVAKRKIITPRSNALHKQPCSWIRKNLSRGLQLFWRAVQRRKPKYMFTTCLQCFSAGCKHVDVGRKLKNAIGDFCGFFDEMLAAIKEKESLSTA